MTAGSPTSHYALGSSDAEHERLIRQAAWLTVHTERLFRKAGIGAGQRVLDVGSGVGDVALIAAQMVGPTGEVVGIERDPRSVARASRMEQLNISLERLGDFETLSERLQAEVEALNTTTPLPHLASAWPRKPAASM